MRDHSKVVILLLLIISNLSCIHKSYQLEQNNILDGKYDSEISNIPASDYIEDIVRSVHLVSILAFYESFEFTYASRVTRNDLVDSKFYERVQSKRYFQKPATGTATVIYYNDRHIAFLTCEHILDFADTLLSFHKDINGRKTNYIKTLAVKTRQNNQIIDIPQANDFEILAADEHSDIAIIGKKLKNKISYAIPVFNYPSGRAKELQWGTRIYLIGFPRGKKMVSTALVSNPDRDKTHSFLLNATFPRGVSGAIVLATRDGIPNFELVGMVNAISAEQKSFLAPFNNDDEDELDKINSYEGEMQVENLEHIFYGVTFAISIESIINLIKSNDQELKNSGFHFDSILSGKGIDFRPY